MGVFTGWSGPNAARPARCGFGPVIIGRPPPAATGRWGDDPTTYGGRCREEHGSVSPASP